MKNTFFKTLIFVVSLALLQFGPARQAKAETFVGSNNDFRVVVALDVNETSVQSMLPDGWTLMPFPGGAFAGANTLVVLVDRYLARDAEGNASEPSTYRGVALASLAKKDGNDEVRVFVTRVYAAAEGYDPYGNAVLARISREATIKSSDINAPARTEEWSVALEGGEMTFSLAYQSGTPSWSAGEAFPYSSSNPEFNRIYRFDQLADLAMSEPIEKALDGEMSIASTIPELSEMFDGTERIVAVVVVPMYVREVFLP